MKICFLTTSFPRRKGDDAGIFLARLVQAIAARDISGIVIAPHDQDSETEEPFESWTILRTKYGIFSQGKLAYGSGILPNLRANPWLLAQAPSLLFSFAVKALRNRKDFDLIHAHWLASSIPGLVCSVIAGKPLIVTIRGEDLKLLGLPVLGKLLRMLLKRPLEITTVSDHFREKLQEYFPEKNIHLIRNGVTRINENPARLELLQKKHSLLGIPYSIYAGRVIPLKRLEILLRLIRLLQNSSLHLVICGSLQDEEYVRQVKQEITDSKLGNRVHLLGATDPDDYALLLSGAKLYFSASEYEGRPNAVLEAMAEGIPAVVSDIPGHAALIRDGHNGLLFAEETLAEAAARIESLLNDPCKYKEMALSATESVKELSWENCALNYISLYKKITAPE